MTPDQPAGEDFPLFENNTPSILYHQEDISFELTGADAVTRWIETVLDRENVGYSTLQFIFCSDPYLHRINLEYLNHNTYTDIITFPYSEPPVIEGDMFISIDRVRENARSLGIPFREELHRVIIHGVLHLCGYKDKTAAQKKKMSAKEDEMLSMLSLK